MAEYTTITDSKVQKAELEADMAEGETWKGYLQRLQKENESPEPEDATKELATDDLDKIKYAFRDVAKDVDQNQPGQNHSEALVIDADHLREIIREEVRRALEDLVS